jgi:hypothetical protein
MWANRRIAWQISHPMRLLDVMYVCGQRGPNLSHAWLQVEDIIVDITADQFGEPPVIVTTNTKWHEGWTWESPRAPICDEKSWSLYPFGAWEAIVKTMKNK